MAEPVPAGSDVSSGTYRCTQCGYELDVSSTKHLPPCPSCGNAEWSTQSGDDPVYDPYPDQSWRSASPPRREKLAPDEPLGTRGTGSAAWSESTRGSVWSRT